MWMKRIWTAAKNWLWVIGKEQRQISREQKLVKVEQSSVSDEQRAVALALRGSHEQKARICSLNKRIKDLNHWIQGLNVRLGNVNEMIHGKGRREGYGKDGSLNGMLWEFVGEKWRQYNVPTEDVEGLT